MTASKPKPKNDMAKLWQLAFKERTLMLASCFFAIISVICSFLPFIAIYFILESLLIHLSTSTDLQKSGLIYYGWVACAAAIAAILLNFAALGCSHLAAYKTLYQLKLTFVKHLSKLPLGFYNEHSTGELRKIVDDSIEKLELFIAHQLPDIIGSIATPIFLFLLLVFFDWRLGLASLLPVLFAYITLIRGYGQKGASQLFENYQKQQENMNDVCVEYVRGISVIKAFNQTFFSFRKFHDAVKIYTDYSLLITQKFENSMGLFLLLLNNVYLFLLPVIIWLSGHVNNYFDFALATIFYLIFSVSISGPFLKLMYVSNFMKQIIVSIRHIDFILEQPPLPAPLSPQPVLRHDIQFDHVTFSYHQQNAHTSPALSDVSFTAKEGQITALVGTSGSGKSTIAHLIPRFYDIQKGVISIGGIDIRAIQPEILESLISFVFQDIFLFKQSIVSNLRIGNPDATLEEVIQAAKATQCHEFIEALPQGYNTVIGTQGVHLSGGEKQRLVFARAIIKNAPILVLDEATAFADPENEYKIQLAMTELMKGRTTIIIAHRLSSIINADQIIVLHEGKIVETGKHETLLQQHGYYARMWAHYNQALQWKIVN